MADPNTFFKDVPVVDAPPTADPATSTKTTTAASNPALAAFNNVPVAQAPDVPTSEVASAAESSLDAEGIGKSIARDKDDITWGDWVGQVGRSAVFNATDYPAAAIVYQQLKADHPDLTYSQTLKMVNTARDEEQTLSADLVGMLAPGLGLIKAGGRAGQAAVKTGMLDGAIRWAGRHPKLARVLQVSSTGAAEGVAFEAIRESVDQTINTAAGDGFSADAVADAAVTGAIIGAVGGPVVDGAAAGAGGVFRWAKAAFGGTEEQAAQATKRFINTIRRPGEALDDTVARFRSDIQAFIDVEGRPPAPFEILPDHQVRDLADVARHFTGLETRIARTTNEAMAEGVTALKQTVDTMGPTIRDTSTVRRMADGVMEDLSRQHGNTMVRVPDEALDVLSNNSAWLAAQARRGNPAAREMERVVTARATVTGLREKLGRLITRRDQASAGEYVADLGAQIARLKDEAFNSSSLDASAIAQLRNLEQLEAALARHQAAINRAGAAGYEVDKLLPMLREAQRILKDVDDNGLLVRYGDASTLRSKASKEAYNTRFSDFDASENAKVIRDTMAQIGADEVPLAKDAVRAYSRAMTRIESHTVGHKALAGSITPENLTEFVRFGIQDGSGTLPTNLRDMGRAGAQEGYRVGMRTATRKPPKNVVDAARSIVEDEALQANIHALFPRQADDLIARMGRLAKTGEGAATAQSVRSPTSLAAEFRDAKEVFSATFVGRLGGAGIAALMSRLLVHAKIPRGTATKLVDMLGDPKQLDDALHYLQRRRVNLGPITAVVLSTLGQNDI